MAELWIIIEIIVMNKIITLEDPPCERFDNDPMSALVKPAFENAGASRFPRKRERWFKSDSRHSTGVYVSWNSLARRINFMHINYSIRILIAVFAPRRKSRLDGYSDQVSTKGVAIKLQAELDAAPRFRAHFSSSTSWRVHTDPSQRSHVALFGITLRKAVTWFSKPGKPLMAQHFRCGNRAATRDLQASCAR